MSRSHTFSQRGCHATRVTFAYVSIVSWPKNSRIMLSERDDANRANRPDGSSNRLPSFSFPFFFSFLFFPRERMTFTYKEYYYCPEVLRFFYIYTYFFFPLFIALLNTRYNLRLTRETWRAYTHFSFSIRCEWTETFWNFQMTYCVTLLTITRLRNIKVIKYRLCIIYFT